MSRENWIKKLKECSREYQANKKPMIKLKGTTNSKSKTLTKVSTKLVAPKLPNYNKLPDNQSKALARTIFNLEARPYIRQQMKIARRIRGNLD